jgi:triacylglycerol esterase/lipase EstA (alpha/beta hydrolase family)
MGHSMGGLIIRSYLAGKREDGTFAPPFNHRIRKAVFIGTPQFGTNFFLLVGSNLV